MDKLKIYLVFSVFFAGVTDATGGLILAKEQEQTNIWKKPDRAELQKTLTPLQCEVTQDGATERPFHNEFWDNKRPGIYVDVVSGEPLFASTDKYDSGTGWPSFSQPIKNQSIVQRIDKSHGMERIEIRSHKGDSHLGHLFDDRSSKTGRRFCVNSASLRFIPVDKLDSAGYGEFKSIFMSVEKSIGPSDDFSSLVSASRQVAVLAGGCFWGMEEILRQIPGVIETQVGYSGGSTANPHYKDVSTGTTGHAEAVQILFDPSKLSYEQLLGWFFRMHDPSTMNRQGNDRGTQYRSAIFYYDDTQKKIAEKVRAHVDASHKWKAPVVTEISPSGPFWRAEIYHQKYLEKNPQGYSCHYLRPE